MREMKQRHTGKIKEGLGLGLALELGLGLGLGLGFCSVMIITYLKCSRIIFVDFVL
jgi:hypothetical protein